MKIEFEEVKQNEASSAAIKRILFDNQQWNNWDVRTDYDDQIVRTAELRVQHIEVAGLMPIYLINKGAKNANIEVTSLIRNEVSVSFENCSKGDKYSTLNFNAHNLPVSLVSGNRRNDGWAISHYLMVQNYSHCLLSEFLRLNLNLIDKSPSGLIVLNGMRRGNVRMHVLTESIRL